jgi:D-xylose transport system substrate-binding protein
VKRLLIVLALAVLATSAVFTATAIAKSKTKKANVQVCALLPDTKSSVRYTLFDAPLLSAAFKKAGLTFSVVNAQGVTTTQISQGQACIADGAKVILVDALDSATGKTVEDAAKAAGVKTIDYDRLVLGGSSAYYVSFNNVTVGQLQGKALIAAMKAKGLIGAGKKPVVAELDGAPTDNNATLFAKGAHLVLDPLFKNGTIKKGPRQAVTNWDNTIAATDFNSMLTKTGNKIDAVLAANDGLAGSVVGDLKAKHLQPVPLTGQDATPGGVQNIISGWQSMTVYKAVPLEAKGASDAAIALIKGTKVPGVNGTTADTVGHRSVKSILEPPKTVNRKNYQILFQQKFLKKGDVCVGDFKKFCKKYSTPYPS